MTSFADRLRESLGRQADLKVGLYVSPRTWTIVEAPTTCIERRGPSVGLSATPPRFSAANGANRMAGNSSSSIASIRLAIDMAACRLRILFRRGRDWSCLDLAGLTRTRPPLSSDRLLFLDLETTGLAGGAGSYAFLVGCGWFEPPSPSASAGQAACFHGCQFFLADFAAERALLESVAELADGIACVVTYNGKTFDLPLIETRFVLQRMTTPFADMAHVDLLHPARRMWREEDVECRLTYLEQALCGHAREGDVPGFEIPSRYFQYVRSGDARPLEAVLEHNRLDIISLAMLTARARAAAG